MKINDFFWNARTKKYTRIVLYTLVVLTSLLFLSRDLITRSVFSKYTRRAEQKFQIRTTIGEIGFTGLRTLRLDSLVIIPPNGDTLFQLQKAEIRLGLWDLMLLKFNPLEIKLDKLLIRLSGGRDSSNYRFLVFPSEKSALNTSSGHISAEGINENRRVTIMYRVMRAFFGLSTAKYIVNDFEFSYRHNPYFAKVTIPHLETGKEGFETTIITEESGNRSSIRLYAVSDKQTNQFSLKASRINEKALLPLVSHKLGVSVAFDTLLFDLTALKLTSSHITLKGKSSVSFLDLYGTRLSQSNVRLDYGLFDFTVNITPNRYEIDSTSSIRVNELNGKIGFTYTPDDRRIAFRCITDEFEVQRLFNSLPENLFRTLQGIKATGKISYSLGIDFSLDMPDSLKLLSKLNTQHLSLVSHGNTNFSTLNDTFTYDVYGDTGYVKSIFIGNQNPDFITLDKISPYVKNSIITAEDGGYYYHKGFDIEGIRYALAQNIKERRFARGGSTITMQLVKNLYLNQNKNLFRKAEEYLIVWLIESNKLVSKDRMLEIYLNIIEWGPGIYGVKDACKYYFDKRPDEVTLEEAIYLASVVPRPSKFKYCFEKDGNLKPFMSDFYSFVANKMLTRTMITQQEFDAIIPNVRLAGPAKNVLFDTTTNTVIDSFQLNDLLLQQWVRDSSLLLH